MKIRPAGNLCYRQFPLFSAAAALSLALALGGCGGSGGGSAPAAINAVASGTSASLHSAATVNSFSITSDDYGIENATYLAASRSVNGIILRAAVASSMTDPDFKTVSRIDLDDPAAVTTGRLYSLAGGNGGYPSFPGQLYFFNGHQSTLLQTVGGTISFDSLGTTPGGTISGSFTAQVADGNDSATPKATYTIAGNFSFTVDNPAAILPAPTPVPSSATAIYQAECASCHSLGALDPSQGGAPDLALKGGILDQTLTGTTAHSGVTLAQSDVAALKVLLNVN